MQPSSTVDNSTPWKIWHSTNYTIGAITFLFGSLLLFPYFSTVLTLEISSALSAWLYTVGSFTFALADFTEWTHYESKIICRKNSNCCAYTSYSLNFFTNFIGSSIYLIGSALFLPSINKAEPGSYCFIVASTITVFAQCWKIGRGVVEVRKRNQIFKTLMQDFTGVLVDIFAGIGALMYFVGSFIFFNPSLVAQVVAPAIFSLGGFLFYLSGVFMLKRYFLNKKQGNGSIQVATTQSKIDERDNQHEISS